MALWEDQHLTPSLHEENDKELCNKVIFDMAAHLQPTPVLTLAPPLQEGRQGDADEEAPLIILSEVNETFFKVAGTEFYVQSR